MADSHVVEATLKVNVEDKGLDALNQKLRSLKSAVKDASTSAKLTGLGAGAAQSKSLREVERAAYAVGTTLRTSLGNAMRGLSGTVGGAFKAIGTNVVTPLRQGLAKGLGVAGQGFFGGLKTLAGNELRGIQGFLGQLKNLGSTMGRVTGITAGLTSALAALGAGFGFWKTFQYAFNAALDTAKETMSLAGKARRFGTDMDTVEDSLATASELMGSGAETMAEKLEKSLERIRMGKGVIGDKAVFQRLGMTQQKVMQFEKNLGRRGMLTDYAFSWAKTIEADDKAIKEAEALGKKGERRANRLKATQRQRLIDLAKVFGPEFVELVTQKFAPQLIKEMSEAQAQMNEALGPKFGAGLTFETPDAFLRASQRVSVGMAAIRRGFGEISNNVGMLVMPNVERMLNAFAGLMKKLGPAFSEAVANIAKGGFDWASESMDNLDTETLSSVIRTIGQTIGDFIRGLPKVSDIDLVSIWDTMQDAASSASSALDNVVTSLDALAGFIDTFNIAKSIERSKQELQMVPFSEQWVETHRRWAEEDAAAVKGRADRAAAAAARERQRQAEATQRRMDAINRADARQAAKDIAADKAKRPRWPSTPTPSTAYPKGPPLPPQHPLRAPSPVIQAKSVEISSPSRLTIPGGETPMQAGRFLPPGGQPIQMPDFSPAAAILGGGVTTGATTAAPSLSAAIVAGAEQGRAVLQGIDLTSAGTAMGNAAVAAIRSGVAGLTIPVKLGPVPSLVGAAAPRTGGDRPSGGE